MDMSNKKVVITIKPNGEVKKDVFGFKGGDCFEYTDWLDKVFGEPTEQVLKDSFHMQSEKDNLNQGLPSGYCG